MISATWFIVFYTFFVIGYLAGTAAQGFDLLSGNQSYAYRLRMYILSLKLLKICEREHSFPRRYSDQQWIVVNHVPILNPSFPALVCKPRGLREAEALQHPAEHHAHLHQRQALPNTDRRSVREREERSRVVLSRRLTFAKPSFWQERIGPVEVSRVAVNAIRVEGELGLLRNEPAWYH